MMKWSWVFVGAFLVLGLLVACVEEGVVGNTAVPTPPPTIEPTVTETAVPVSVVRETAVTRDRVDIPQEDFQNEGVAPLTATAMPSVTTESTDFIDTMGATPQPPLILELPNEDVKFRLNRQCLRGCLML